MALADGTTAPRVDWLQGGFYGDFEPEMKIRDGRCGESGAVEGKGPDGLADVNSLRPDRETSFTNKNLLHTS
jgi:hypothetical protein